MIVKNELAVGKNKQELVALFLHFLFMFYVVASPRVGRKKSRNNLLCPSACSG